MVPRESGVSYHNIVDCRDSGYYKVPQTEKFI